MSNALEAVVQRAVSRETEQKLRDYLELLLKENKSQNLISRNTEEDAWERHILDSAQIVPLARKGMRWVDIGSGAGLPGVVVAIISGDPMTLVEPRRLRADFLAQVVARLRLENVHVVHAKAQSAKGKFDVMTARAVAKAGEIIGITRHLAHRDTQYLLMKGRTAQSELEDVKRSWQGKFRLVESCTDSEAAILVAEGVRGKGRA